MISAVEHVSQLISISMSDNSNDSPAEWWSIMHFGTSGNSIPGWLGPAASTMINPPKLRGQAGDWASRIRKSVLVLPIIARAMVDRWIPHARALGPMMLANAQAEPTVSMSPFRWVSTAMAPRFIADPIHWLRRSMSSTRVWSNPSPTLIQTV